MWLTTNCSTGCWFQAMVRSASAVFALVNAHARIFEAHRLDAARQREPQLFAHWHLLASTQRRTVGVVWRETVTYGSKRAGGGGSLPLLTRCRDFIRPCFQRIMWAVLCMRFCYHDCMQSTSVRIDVGTHRELKVLAASLGVSVGDTVALAVRRLRQDRIGTDLAQGLSAEEVDWLDADLG
jgi:hypothetical protein